MSKKIPIVLTIAGSDSGGGAGIQADLKTFSAYATHGISAITASTAQNTLAVTAIHPLPVRHIRAQIDALFDDFEIAAVKIGMLASAAIVRVVAAGLREHAACPVVLDPVMIASSGASLMRDAALRALLDQLLPLATLVTPNVPEAERLTGLKLRDANAFPATALALRSLGARAVLLKGGHLPGNQVSDFLVDGSRQRLFRHRRLRREGHGTGCTLASAIAAQLAIGANLFDAVADGIDFVHGALRHGYRPGHARCYVLNHAWRYRLAPAHAKMRIG